MNEREIGEWLVSTCRLYGASEATCFEVAGIFLRGLNRQQSGPAQR